VDLDELSTRALLVRILRELEENERRSVKIEDELAYVAHTVRKIEREVRPKPQPLTASVVDVFSGESITMADLILNVGQTSTDTVTPLLADGVTPSGGVVSNLAVTFSDPSATVSVSGVNTLLVTGVAASAGAISGTRSCTITDTDGAVSQWTASFTVTTNAPVPPSQLTQSVVDVFSVPTP
jgi:hypothetical protein